MAAHQAPLSLGFSRQEHWSGLPFPSPMSESEVAQPCPTLSDPMDRSLPGSSIQGIFQARELEWGAIAFSYCGQKNIPFLLKLIYLVGFSIIRSENIPHDFLPSSAWAEWSCGHRGVIALGRRCVSSHLIPSPISTLPGHHPHFRVRM